MTLPAPFDRLSANAQQRLHKQPMPDWLAPMLAHLSDDVFSDAGWIYERKLDGERCLAYCRGDDVQLLSRNQKSLNVQYPELVAALQSADLANAILDGEVVTFDENGVTSFSRLQDRMHVSSEEEARSSDVAVTYYLFDVLYLGNFDTTALPQRARKVLLKDAVAFADPLRYLPHRNEDGTDVYHEACRKGWEGVIAKQADAGYVNGRSRQWLKFKCVHQQEFVIGGYTAPHGERVEFGALLLGYYDDGALRYAGKVGTGFDEETLHRLGDKLANLARKTSPFATNVDEKEVHFVTPQLVAEIGFTEWTDDDKLRHPRYLGLRRDKDAEDVERERPL